MLLKVEEFNKNNDYSKRSCILTGVKKPSLVKCNFIGRISNKHTLVAKQTTSMKIDSKEALVLETKNYKDNIDSSEVELVGISGETIEIDFLMKDGEIYKPLRFKKSVKSMHTDEPPKIIEVISSEDKYESEVKINRKSSVSDKFTKSKSELQQEVEKPISVQQPAEAPKHQQASVNTLEELRKLGIDGKIIERHLIISKCYRDKAISLESDDFDTVITY